MKPDVIVQAGGKGTRLEHYCWNKPKCLIPVDGKPILYRLFDQFPESRFHVISEHKADVLLQYLEVFPPGREVHPVAPDGPGTLGGLAQALEGLEPGRPFWLVWSDLVFQGPLPEMNSSSPVIFLSRNFPCRWAAPLGENGVRRLTHERSSQEGVMGLFWFPGKEGLEHLPHGGEFVEWLASHIPAFEVAFCDEAEELGTLSALQNHWDSAASTRFFNQITFLGSQVVKEATLPEYQPMITQELVWYEQVEALGFTNIPAILARSPMTLARVEGQHPHQLRWGAKGRRQILENIMETLERLHGLGQRPVPPGALRGVYLDKTAMRLGKIRRLVPELGQRRHLKVNGVWVPNILHPDEAPLLEACCNRISCPAFTVIHGDPTFSNTLVDAELKPWFIDPRGYFHEPGIYGDPNYDWAKLYYSVVGNYDNFNRRQFILSLDSTGADVEIRGSGWAHLQDFFQERFGGEFRSIQLLHALIWLSLSGWVDDDYDSILAAYFNGIYHLHAAMEV
jgi:hypothetical protein